MEILCCSKAVFARWHTIEPQGSTSENNGSAREFHYNIKDDKFISSPPPLYNIYSYIPLTSHVATTAIL
jgi:hypothetical protein